MFGVSYMKLQEANKVTLRFRPTFIVVEVGEYLNGEMYVEVMKCDSMSEARKIFTERLKNFFEYEEDEEDDEEFESFEESYRHEIYVGKYTDPSNGYFLQIKKI